MERPVRMYPQPGRRGRGEGGEREGEGGREGGRRREGRGEREERREEACCSIVVSKVMQGKYTDAFSIQAKYTDLIRSMNGVPWLCCAEWRRGR